MPDVGVEEQVEGDPLLGGPTVQAERVTVAADQPDLLVGADPAEAAAARRQQDEAGVARQLGGRRRARRGRPRRARSISSTVTSSSVMPVQPESTASSARYSSASRPTADALTRIGRSLLTTVTSKPSADRFLATDEDAGVVVPQAEPGRQDLRVGVVQLDPQGAPVLADRHRAVEPALLDPQVVEQPQGLAGEVAELRMVPLALQLGDHDHREHDLVLLEPEHRLGVREEDRGVEDEGFVAGGHVRLLTARRGERDLLAIGRPGPDDARRQD